nr:hypothetical protein [Amnibacterium kyonggiense]
MIVVEVVFVSAETATPGACGVEPRPSGRPSGGFGAQVCPVKSSSTASRR